MSTFVFRLKAPRPTFALDMSDEEREIMARHAEHWRPWVESGQMVVFGPVLDASGSWGLGVVEADDEQELRAFAADDPVVTTGTGTIEVGKMLGGLSGHGRTASQQAGDQRSRQRFSCGWMSRRGALAGTPSRAQGGAPLVRAASVSG